MEIVQVVGNGDFGGGTTVVLELSRELMQRGANVSIVSQTGSYIIEMARKHDIPAIGLDFRRRASSLANAWKLCAELRRNPGAVVHAHGARACLPAVLMSAVTGNKIIYTIHGFHYAQKSFGVKNMARGIERFCIAHADEIIFVCDHDYRLASRDRLLSQTDHHRIIYNGSSSETVIPANGEPTFDILFLGRLHPQKNPMLLAEVLLALRPLRPKLGIVGGGVLERALRSRIAEAGLSDQVTFVGEVPHRDAGTWLRRARMLLLVSAMEGLPLAAIEAMHAGVPVVASAVGGLPELIEHCSSGFLVTDITSESEYVRYINILMSNDTLRRNMALRGQELAQQRFALDGFLAKHLSLYEQLASGCIAIRGIVA
jgi:glycosyltransferase involved in cell wall biosynthesis